MWNIATNMLKKLLILIASLGTLCAPLSVSAQVFSLSQIASSTQSSPYSGILTGDGISSHKAVFVSLSSIFPFTPQTWGVSTSTTVGFTNGLLATASSTFTSNTYFPSGIWNSSGNVGIGTTSPYSMLSVAGQVVAQNYIATSTTASLFTGGFLSLASSTIGNGTQVGGLTITGGSTTTLNAYFASNVGIGTTSPYSRLSVWGAGTGTGQDFSVVNNASTTLLQVLDNGNVGVGTTSPFAQLSIATPPGATGSLSTLFAIASSTSGGTSTLLSVNNNGTLVLNGTNTGIPMQQWNTSLSDHFCNVSVHGYGGFQVCDSSPLFLGYAPFAGGTGLFSNMTGRNVGGTGSYYFSNNFAVGFVLDPIGGSFGWNTAPSRGAGSSVTLTTRMVLTNAGNLGIGTTTPYSKLSVWGANTTSGVRAFEVTNSASTTSLYVDNAGLTTIQQSSTTLATINSAWTGPLNFDTDAGIVQAMNLPFSAAANTTPQGYQFQLNGSTTIAVYGQENGSGYLNDVQPLVGISTSTPTAPFTVQIASSSVAFSPGFDIWGLMGTTEYLFQRVDQWAHLILSGPPPVLSSCGTNPTVTGNDRGGYVTVGSVSATGCTITFAHAYSARPSCTLTNESMSVVNAMTYTVSASAITVTQTGLTGDVLDYQCQQPV